MAHVLVVEDDPDMERLIVHRLSDAGYDVTSESDGQAGLAAIRESRPDLVVLDWMMPRLTGIEVCEEIRKDVTLEKTRILMVTAKSQKADIDRAYAAGVTQFLRKPFSLRELVLGVDSVLAGA